MKDIIIIGEGTSVSEGISKGLWEKLKSKWTIGLNHSYNFFDSTILSFADIDFYKKEFKKEKFKNLPLIIGKKHKFEKVLDNTILLKTYYKYTRDLSKGVYKSSLVGIFALSLAIYLLDIGTIYLLGYDWGAQGKDEKNRPHTHYYQGKIEHRGIGHINFYTEERVKRDFSVYKNEEKVKIYNVSLKSKISVFPKISYTQFFSMLSKNDSYDQNQLRISIKAKLKKIK